MLSVARMINAQMFHAVQESTVESCKRLVHNSFEHMFVQVMIPAQKEDACTKMSAFVFHACGLRILMVFFILSANSHQAGALSSLHPSGCLSLVGRIGDYIDWTLSGY